MTETQINDVGPPGDLKTNRIIADHRISVIKEIIVDHEILDSAISEDLNQNRPSDLLISRSLGLLTEMKTGRRE